MDHTQDDHDDAVDENDNDDEPKFKNYILPTLLNRNVLVR